MPVHETTSTATQSCFWFRTCSAPTESIFFMWIYCPWDTTKLSKFGSSISPVLYFSCTVQTWKPPILAVRLRKNRGLSFAAFEWCACRIQVETLHSMQSCPSFATSVIYMKKCTSLERLLFHGCQRNNKFSIFI